MSSVSATEALDGACEQSFHCHQWRKEFASSTKSDTPWRMQHAIANPREYGQARLRAAKIAETTDSRQIQLEAAFRRQHSHECRRCPERTSSNSKLHTHVSAYHTKMAVEKSPASGSPVTPRQKPPTALPSLGTSRSLPPPSSVISQRLSPSSSTRLRQLAGTIKKSRQKSPAGHKAAPAVPTAPPAVSAAPPPSPRSPVTLPSASPSPRPIVRTYRQSAIENAKENVIEKARPVAPFSPTSRPLSLSLLAPENARQHPSRH